MPRTTPTDTTRPQRKRLSPDLVHIRQSRPGHHHSLQRITTLLQPAKGHLSIQGQGPSQGQDPNHGSPGALKRGGAIPTLAHTAVATVTVTVAATAAVTAAAAAVILAAPPSAVVVGHQVTWTNDASPGPGVAIGTGGDDPGRTLGVAGHDPACGQDLVHDPGHRTILHVVADLTTRPPGCCYVHMCSQAPGALLPPLTPSLFRQ